jgi:hypothetical protein
MKAFRAAIYATSREREKAETFLSEATAGTSINHHAMHHIGVAYAQLGDLPKARLWLARAAESGFPCYPWYAREPLLQPLRGDAEYLRFLEDLRKSWVLAKKRYGSEQK